MECVIAAHPYDSAAQAVMHVLRDHFRVDVTLMHPEWLGQTLWMHSIDRTGTARTKLTLPDRRTLSCEKIGFLWNRCTLIPLPQFRESSPADRNYAGCEILAAFKSFLAGLKERVEPHVTCERCEWSPPSQLELETKAARCGLKYKAISELAGTPSILVTPTRLVHDTPLHLPVAANEMLRRFAKLLGFNFLRLHVEPRSHTLKILGVDTVPVYMTAAEITAIAGDIAIALTAAANR